MLIFKARKMCSSVLKNFQSSNMPPQMLLVIFSRNPNSSELKTDQKECHHATKGTALWFKGWDGVKGNDNEVY